MLIFSRREDEAIRIDENTRITIIDIHDGEIRFMIREIETTPGCKSGLLTYTGPRIAGCMSGSVTPVFAPMGTSIQL